MALGTPSGSSFLELGDPIHYLPSTWQVSWVKQLPPKLEQTPESQAGTSPDVQCQPHKLANILKSQICASHEEEKPRIQRILCPCTAQCKLNVASSDLDFRGLSRQV